jgi:hypothetical protein
VAAQPPRGFQRAVQLLRADLSWGSFAPGESQLEVIRTVSAICGAIAGVMLAFLATYLTVYPPDQNGKGLFLAIASGASVIWVAGVLLFAVTEHRIVGRQGIKFDEMHAWVLDQKAATEYTGARRKAAALSAELLRFLVRREQERPTADWAYSVTGDRNIWQRVFFGSSGQHFISSMNEYFQAYKDRVDKVTASLGGDDEITRLNTPPLPAWPTDVRVIGERLAALAERPETAPASASLKARVLAIAGGILALASRKADILFSMPLLLSGRPNPYRMFEDDIRDRYFSDYHAKVRDILGELSRRSVFDPELKALYEKPIPTTDELKEIAERLDALGRSLPL